MPLNAYSEHVEFWVAVNDMPKAPQAYWYAGGMCRQGYEVLDFLADLDGAGRAVHQDPSGADVVGRKSLGNVPRTGLSQLNRKGDAEVMWLYWCSRNHWATSLVQGRQQSQTYRVKKEFLKKS
jgi:hypothetical protein